MLKINNLFYKKNKLILLFIIFYILIFMRDIEGKNISSILFSVLIIISMFLLNIEESIALLMYAFPFYGGIPFNEIILIYVLTIIIKENKKLIFNKFIIFPLFLICIEVINLFYGHISFVEFFRWTTYIILITILLLGKRKLYNPYLTIISYSIGTLMATLTVLIITLNNISIERLIQSGQRLGNTGAYVASNTYITKFNPNELGVFIIIAISSLMVLYSKSIRYKYILILFMTILTILGILTLSRAFLVCLLLNIFLVMMLDKKNFLKYIWMITIFLIIFSIIIYGNQSFFNGIFQNMFNRFETNDILNGRREIMSDYFTVIISSIFKFLFGSGIQNYASKNNLEFVAHNATQEIFVAWGIIGFIVILMIFRGIYLNAIEVNKKRVEIITLLPTFSLIIICQSGQFFSSYGKMLFLVILICSIALSKKKNNEFKDEEKVN